MSLAIFSIWLTAATYILIEMRSIFNKLRYLINFYCNNFMGLLLRIYLVYILSKGICLSDLFVSQTKWIWYARIFVNLFHKLF